MRCYNPIKLKVEDTFVKRGKVLVCEPRFITVACGKCLACLGQKSNELAMRCEHESIYYNYGRNACFVTLTYDNEHLPCDYSLKIKDFQDFMKRLRIYLQRKVDKNYFIKYFCCGEYGSKRGRPHYHLILFGMPNNDFTNKIISSRWKNGYIYIDNCNSATIKYVAKYMNKAKSLCLNRSDYLKHTGRERPFRLMSKGLGKRWLQDYYKSVIKNDFKISYNGSFYSTPRSYIRWLYKLNLCSDVSDKLKELSRKRFVKELSRLYKQYNIKEETLLKYASLPDEFKYSLEYYDDFYALWHKELEDTRYSYETRHEEYLVNLKNSNKYKDFYIA